MGRKKKVSNLNIKTLDFQKHIEGSPLEELSYNVDGRPYVKWGRDNNMPELLLDLYNQSPTHSSAIRFAVNVIVGGGIDYDAMKLNGSDITPNYKYSYDDLLRYIALDYVIFGTFALQIIKNKDGKTYTYYHCPMANVRYSEYDDDGTIQGYYICSDWTETGVNPPIYVKSFVQNSERIKVGEPYLYVYHNYNPVTKYYPVPTYNSALKAIQTECQIINFDLKTTINGFVPSGMLVLNDYETEEEKQAVVREIQKMFVGTENANSLMITFRNNVEDNVPEFVPFTTNASNYNLYSDSDARTRVRILAAHRISDAALCGLPSIGATGFASEADKLKTALAVYERLVGTNNRNVIIGALNFLFSTNGIEQELILKPFSFDIEEQVQVTRSEDNGEEDVRITEEEA